MSGGYLFAAGSTIIMYTLLPIMLTKLWSESAAGITIMVMTILQIFLFGPIAANFVDRYGARKVFFAYTGLFILGAVLRYLFYGAVDHTWQVVFMILMLLCFSAGFGTNFISVYTLRVTPPARSGLAFGILTAFAGFGRLLGTLIQPGLIQEATQLYGPIILVVCMVIFMVVVFFAKSDLAVPIVSKNKLESNIKTSLTDALNTYGHTFYRGRRFIKRGRHFPLIPLTSSLFKGIFYGSLYFLVPIYLLQHPEFHSSGLEIGIYELMSLCFAVIFGHIADKGKSLRNMIIGRCGVIVGMILLATHPSIAILIPVGIIIGLSDDFLYANSQYILAKYDADHENDGAYTWTRNIIDNIGYMFMPAFRGLLIAIDFDLLFELFASIIGVIAIIGLIIAVYLFYVRDFREKKQTLSAVSDGLIESLPFK